MENIRVYFLTFDEVCEYFESKYKEFTSTDDIKQISDDEFQTLAEDYGNVFSMKGFENMWNYDTDKNELLKSCYIRFLKV